MDTPTRNLSNHVKKRGINLSYMARDTGIPYSSLYDSLLNEKRERSLRVGEFLTICRFLEVPPEIFAEREGKEEHEQNG